LLTDFFVADPADAERLASFQSADRPDLSTNNADNLILGDLLDALGQPQAAEALRGEGCLVFSSDSVWVFQLPDELVQSLATLPSQGLGSVCAKWAAGEELAFHGVSAADLETPLQNLRGLAEASTASAKPILLRTAI
jgi:hypothetical protein